MIDLYTWSTPNGRKASIALEESGLPYTVHPVDIGQKVQFADWFVKISPSSKIPAIVDRDEGDLAIFESGALLIYIAEKAGTLLPRDARGRSRVLSWLFFQVGQIGPYMGQAAAFRRYIEDGEVGIKRFTKLAYYALGVLDTQLAKSEFLAGDYSIADIATFPWVRSHQWCGLSLDEYPNVRRWNDVIEAREAVQRGLAVPKRTELDDKATREEIAAAGRAIALT